MQGIILRTGKTAVNKTGFFFFPVYLFPYLRSPKKMHAMEKKISGKLYKWEEAYKFKCSDN